MLSKSEASGRLNFPLGLAAARGRFLPNGSVRPLPQGEFQLIYPLPQGLEAQQHSQHPFELSVEVDLIAAEPLQVVGVE